MYRARVSQRWQQATKRERELIRRHSKRASDAVMRCRCKVILALVQGKTPTMISDGGLCSRAQVYRVVDRFVEHGLAGLVDAREDNGGNKITEAYEAELLSILEGSPQDHSYLRPTWTQELLVIVLEERTQIRVSVTTMSRLLARLGVRLGRPKPMVNCPWPKQRRMRRLAAIRRLIKNRGRGEVVLYSDEVDIHLNPKIGPDWMLPGIQKRVLTPGCNEKRYLAGAFDHRTGKLTWVEGERKNSLLFLQLLHKLVTKTYRRAQTIHLILDNYGIHDSLQVKLALKVLGDKVKFHFLPPYCPDHNRIERIWRDLHDNVTRNHRCKKMADLMVQVNRYLRNRNHTGGHAYAKADAA